MRTKLSSLWELRSSRYFFSFLNSSSYLCVLLPLCSVFIYLLTRNFMSLFFFQFWIWMYFDNLGQYFVLFYLPVVKWSVLSWWVVSGIFHTKLFITNFILEVIMQLNDYYRNPTWCWIFTSWCAFILSYSYYETQNPF